MSPACGQVFDSLDSIVDWVDHSSRTDPSLSDLTARVEEAVRHFPSLLVPVLKKDHAEFDRKLNASNGPDEHRRVYFGIRNDPHVFLIELLHFVEWTKTLSEEARKTTGLEVLRTMKTLAAQSCAVVRRDPRAMLNVFKRRLKRAISSAKPKRRRAA